MTPLSGTQFANNRLPVFDGQLGHWGEQVEGKPVHASSVRQERLSLAERIEQALLEAERLHGD